MKEVKPIVSVIISSYNHEKYISYTIESILKQSFQYFELIIIDDFSQDRTYEIIKKFAKQDSRIIHFRNKENLGPSINLNKAINIVKSNYIALIASDDTMKENRLEVQFNFLEKNQKYSAVFSHVNIIDENNNQINHNAESVFNGSFGSREEILNHFFYRGNFLNAPSAMLRKQDVLQVKYHKNSSFQLQDFDLWVKMLLAKKEFFCLEEKLTFYRISNNNLSSIGSKKPNLNCLSRSLIDNQQILENFLIIDDLEEFKKIFPDCVYKKNLQKDLIKFYIGIEAYKNFKLNNNIIYYNFAYNVVSRIIDNDFLRKLAKEKHSFSIKDFLEIANSNPLAKIILNQNIKIINKKSFFQRLQNSIKKRITKIKKCIK